MVSPRERKKRVSKLISLGQWARRVGVSRQRAHQWYQEGRLKARPREMPDGRIMILIAVNTPRPEPLRGGRS